MSAESVRTAAVLPPDFEYLRVLFAPQPSRLAAEASAFRWARAEGAVLEHGDGGRTAAETVASLLESGVGRARLFGGSRRADRAA